VYLYNYLSQQADMGNALVNLTLAYGCTLRGEN